MSSTSVGHSRGKEREGGGEMVRQANGEIEMVCHDLWPSVCCAMSTLKRDVRMFWVRGRCVSVCLCMCE